MTLFPKTQRGKDLQMVCFRCLIIAGVIVLLVQVWARVSLAGLRRQDIEELLRPFAAIFGPTLVWCSVIAVFQRQRFLALAAAAVGIISVIICLLPFLMHEGVYD